MAVIATRAAALPGAVLGVFVALLIVAAPGRAADPAAEALLKGIYANYVGPDSKGVDFTSPVEAARIFPPDLAALIAADVAESAMSDDVGRLDFDPFVDAQDWQVKSVDVKVEDAPDSAADSTGGTEIADATASFDNFDETHTVRFALVKTAAGWRIADILWDDEGPSFHEMLDTPPE
jgi:hypothetical protein